VTAPLTVLRNPLRTDSSLALPHPLAETDAGSGEPVQAFHQRFADYEPTPLLDVPTLALDLGVGRVLVKDESSRLGLPAFKMLGASWASYRSLVERFVERTSREPGPWRTLDELAEELAPLHPMTLATATDGNHGRAVARFARLMGMGARIFVPEGTTASRIDAILGEGATCEVVDGTYDDAVARAGLEAAADCLVVSDTSWPGYEIVPLWVIEGYSTIFAEIDAQRAAAGLADPDVVVVPIGVGALAAAVARWFRRPELTHQPVLVGVEPDTANCVMASAEAGHLVEVPGPHRSVMAGLNCGEPSPVAWPWVSAGFDWFVAGGDDLAVDGMRLLADRGIVSGESGACTVGALAALAAGAGAAAGLVVGPEATVLVLSTEGATDPPYYESVVGRTPAAVAGARP